MSQNAVVPEQVRLQQPFELDQTTYHRAQTILVIHNRVVHGCWW